MFIQLSRFFQRNYSMCISLLYPWEEVSSGYSYTAILNHPLLFSYFIILEMISFLGHHIQ